MMPKDGECYFRKLDNMLVEVVEIDDNTIYYRDVNRLPDDVGVMGCHKLLWDDRFSLLHIDNEVIDIGGIF